MLDRCLPRQVCLDLIRCFFVYKNRRCPFGYPHHHGSFEQRGLTAWSNEPVPIHIKSTSFYMPFSPSRHYPVYVIGRPRNFCARSPLTPSFSPAAPFPFSPSTLFIVNELARSVFMPRP